MRAGRSACGASFPTRFTDRFSACTGRSLSRATSASCIEKTGALGVDMELHKVARAAVQHGVPLAVIRVVVDPVERTIPRSALAATRPDGTIDPLAVARSLMRYPRDLIGLVRMSLDARAARATLVQGSALLGPGLGLLDSRAAARDRACARSHTGRPRIADCVTQQKSPAHGRAFVFVWCAALIPPPSDAPARARLPPSRQHPARPSGPPSAPSRR